MSSQGITCALSATRARDCFGDIFNNGVSQSHIKKAEGTMDTAEHVSDAEKDVKETDYRH
jgi:hypothetical protein